MKLLWIGGPLALGYLVFQGFALLAVSEMLSSKMECDNAILDTLKTVHSTPPSKATEQIEAGCFRMQVNAHVAEKVLSTLP